MKQNMSYSGRPTIPQAMYCMRHWVPMQMLTLNPTSAQQGVYNNVRITVSDPNGGSDFTQFNLTVNGNYDPTIGSISPYTMNEGDHVVIPLSATDLNGDNISWTVQNLPNA